MDVLCFSDWRTLPTSSSQAYTSTSVENAAAAFARDLLSGFLKTEPTGGSGGCASAARQQPAYNDTTVGEWPTTMGHLPTSSPPRVSMSTSSAAAAIGIVSPLVKIEPNDVQGGGGHAPATARKPTCQPSAAGGKDKWGPSPNGMAKCQVCRSPILKGAMRIGKWTYDPYFETYRHLYYHQGCATPEVKASLQLPDPSLEAERQQRLRSRAGLREELRLVRLAFSRRLQIPAYMIFDNKVLDELTIKCPTTKSELLKCYGIKEKRCQNYGAAILAVTRRWESRAPATTRRSASDPWDDNDGDAIEAGSMSCEEIVSVKFEHAKANGYVIDLD